MPQDAFLLGGIQSAAEEHLVQASSVESFI